MLLAIQIVLIKLLDGKEGTCTEHNLETKGNCKKKGNYLECKPPFHLHTFPGHIKCKQLREAWIKAMRQEPFDKKRSWQPTASDRVCSIYFVDGLETDENPISTLFSSLQNIEKKSRRTFFRKPLEKKVRGGNIIPATSASQEEDVPLQANFIDGNLDINMEEINEPMEVIHEPMKNTPGDHTYCLSNSSTPCYVFQDKSNLVKAIFSKINELTLKK